MTGEPSASDHQVLQYAARYVELVAAFRGAERSAHPSILSEMDDLFRACSLEIEKEKERRLHSLPAHLRHMVKARKPFDCEITASEAEAVRLYYATPPATALDILSGEELILLGDHFEGWAHDRRNDFRMMIELLGWSDGMRSLAGAVGETYQPLPAAEGTKVPLLKFIANKLRSPSEN